MANFNYPPEHHDCRCSMVKAAITSVKIKLGDGKWVDLSSDSCVVGGVLLMDALHNPLFNELRAIVAADETKANSGSL